jgi:hypothetical protein
LLSLIEHFHLRRSAVALTSLRLRILHRAENIGSALKREFLPAATCPHMSAGCKKGQPKWNCQNTPLQSATILINLISASH